MRAWLKYSLYAVAWALIGGYIIYASHLSSRYGEAQCVTSIEVHVVDSTQRSTLVRESRVYQWIERSDYVNVGKPVSQIDLVGLESFIGGNGFVSQVSSYINRDGVLHVDIKQREPILRLCLDGYDSYITEDGYLFSSPSNSAHYCLVATGDYRPIFPASFQGYMDDYFEQQLKEYDSKIESIEREKYPLYTQQRELKDEWDDFYENGYVKPKFRESEEGYAKRLREKRLSNHRLRSRLNWTERSLKARITSIDKRKEKVVFSKNIFIQKHQDFKKLIIFAKTVESDHFWSSEAVQLILSQPSVSSTSRSVASAGGGAFSPLGGVNIEIIPRSSDCRISFGTLQREREKLDKAERFYREVVRKVGWDRYKVIDLEYKNQVVCR